MYACVRVCAPETSTAFGALHCVTLLIHNSIDISSLLFWFSYFSRCFCSGMNGIFSIRQREYKLLRDRYMCTWTEIHSRVLPYFTWLQSPCSFSSVLFSFRSFVVQCSVNAQQDVVVFVVHVLIFALPSILGAYHETNHNEYDHICRMKYWVIYKWRYEIYIDIPMMEIGSIRFESWPFPTPLVERIANLSHASAHASPNSSVVRTISCMTAIMVLVWLMT